MYDVTKNILAKDGRVVAFFSLPLALKRFSLLMQAMGDLSDVLLAVN